MLISQELSSLAPEISLNHRKSQMRTMLGAERSLADTCLGRLHDRRVQRVGHGRYVSLPPAQEE